MPKGDRGTTARGTRTGLHRPGAGGSRPGRATTPRSRPIGVALGQLRDLDDAQGEHFSRRVLVAVGSKANPALFDGLPCPIEGVSQDFHFVSVEAPTGRLS